MSGRCVAGDSKDAGLPSQARRFLLVILFVSLAPWLLYHPFIFSEGALAGAQPVQVTLTGIWLVANAHVGITGFFWIDADYRAHIRAAPLYFYALPAAIVATFAVAVHATGQTGMLVFLVVASAWNFHHFGRQNWGLICLSASATGSGRPVRAEFWTAEIGALAAILPLLSKLPIAWLEGFHAPVGRLAAGLGVAVAIAGLLLGARHVVQGAHPLRAAMSVMTGLFFLPVHLVEAPQGFIAVAVAHSYQYCTIIGFMAASRHPSGPARWMLPLVALTVVYVAVFRGYDLVDWGEWAPVSSVFLLSLAMWHYLIDADLW